MPEERESDEFLHRGIPTMAMDREDAWRYSGGAIRESLPDSASAAVPAADHPPAPSPAGSATIVDEALKRPFPPGQPAFPDGYRGKEGASRALNLIQAVYGLAHGPPTILGHLPKSAGLGIIISGEVA